MKQSTFLIFCLVLSLGLLQSYNSFQKYFADPSPYLSKLEKMKKEYEREVLARKVQEAQFEEFKQEVASVLPLRKKPASGEKGYALRQLASVVTTSESLELKESLASSLIARAKAHFRAERYEKSKELLQKVIDRYSYTSFIPEAYFLMAESQYQLGAFEDCAKTINQMVVLFPENELTGLSLIRLGRIYEGQDKIEEAISIYKTVIKSFPQREVAAQAVQSLKIVEP